MQVIFVAAEVAPFSASSELAEVVSQLAQSLAEEGTTVTIVAPLLRGISPERFSLARRLIELQIPVGGESVKVGVLEGRLPSSNVPVVFLDQPGIFTDATISAGTAGGHRAAYLLAQGALELCPAYRWQPEIFHAVGWPAGLLPLLAARRYGDGPGSPTRVFTFDDASATGCFPAAILDELALGREDFHPDGLELHGQVSLLKAGVRWAHAATTMSQTLAERLPTEAVGGGLHGFFAAHRARLWGITPGLNLGAYNPASDHRLAARYDAKDLTGREACKRALQRDAGLPLRADAALVGVAAPTADQEGMGLFLAAARDWHGLRAQFVVQGPLDEAALAAVRLWVSASPEQVAYRERSDDLALRQLLAGADFLLVPDRRVTTRTQQLLSKALHYGAVVIAHDFAGVYDDTIIVWDDPSLTGTSFLFPELTAEALLVETQRALASFDKDSFADLRRNGMRQEPSWGLAARRYADLYRRVRPQPQS